MLWENNPDLRSVPTQTVIVLLFSEIKCYYNHPGSDDVAGYLSTRRIGQIAQYNCRNGYRKKANLAKCTKKGWEPAPLCEGIFMLICIK